jgi:hypothetical protein
MSDTRKTQQATCISVPYAIMLTTVLTAWASIKGLWRQEIRKMNKRLVPICWGLTILGSLMGLSIPGLLGAAISLILAMLASMWAPYAVKTIICMREIK